jgi:hypothetical protein
LRTNFILIDHENVHLEALAGLDAEHFEALLFVGANQSKLPFELVAAVQKLGTRAEYVKISGNGSNALDFHIAFYIGQLAAHEPKAYFHIISKDTGFDPLTTTAPQKITIARSSSITASPCSRHPTPRRHGKKLADRRQPKQRDRPSRAPTRHSPSPLAPCSRSSSRRDEPRHLAELQSKAGF